MRAKAFVVVLSALLVLVFGMTAMAQVSHNVTAANTQLVYKGTREVLGGISLTATTITTTNGGSIYITYTKPFTNGALGTVTDSGSGTNPRTFTYANGMVLTVRQPAVGVGTNANGYCSSAGWAISSAQNINNGTQAQIVISVPATTTVGGTTAVVVNPQDQISVDGVRANIGDMNVGDNVWAYMSSIPSQANTYNPANIIVATVQPNFSLINVTPGAGVVCAGVSASSTTFTIREGFAGAFVQHNSASQTNSRPPYAAAANRSQTGFKFTVTGFPGGVTATWPSTVTNTTTGATLTVVTGAGWSVTTAGVGTISYVYNAPNQGLADMNIETFDFTVTFVVNPATAVVGSATFQAQMTPLDVASSNTVPMFLPDPKNVPADVFFSINRCVTYLLYPYVTHGGGFDTGIAIANTSLDTGVFPTGAGAVQQSAGATIYYFRAFQTGGTSAGALAFPISVIETGNTWSAAMSVMNNTVAGFANTTGYMIAKCNFQNAHGFAYIAYNLTTTAGVAQSYTAKVIPDPVIWAPIISVSSGNSVTTSKSRASTTTALGGESLGE